MTLADTLYEELQTSSDLRGYSQAYIIGYMISILDACADMDENVARMIQFHINSVRQSNADYVLNAKAYEAIGTK